MKDPNNCPFCEAEVEDYSKPWGLSPEGWAAIERKHKEEHKDE